MFRGYTEKTRLVGGHHGAVTAVAFSPHATYLATAGLDSKVCIWETTSSTLFYVFQGDSTPLSLAWAPHRDDRLLCGLANGYVVYLSFSPNVVKARGLIVHTFPVECLAISGSQVASGAHRELRVWDWQGEGPWYHLADIPEPPDPYQGGDRVEVLVTSVQWTEHELIATYLNHGIRIFQTRSWNCTQQIAADSHIIRAALSGDERFLLSSNLSTGFDLHDLDSQCVVRALGQDVGERGATPIKFIESDRAAVGGSAAGTIHIWDVDTGRRVQTLDHAHAVLALDAHHDKILDRFLIATGMAADVAAPVTLWTKKHLNDAPPFKSEVVEDSGNSQGSPFAKYNVKVLVGGFFTTIAIVAILLILVAHKEEVPSASAILPQFDRPEDPSTQLRLSLFDDDDDDYEDIWGDIFRRVEEGSLVNVDGEHPMNPEEIMQQKFLANVQGGNLLRTQDIAAGVVEKTGQYEGVTLVPEYPEYDGAARADRTYLDRFRELVAGRDH